MKKKMFTAYIAEFIGTFALVFFGCGARSMIGDTTNPAGILVVHLAFAFTVGAMIYALSHVSAAVFNPAITLGFARRFPWRSVVPYWLAQCLGAILAITLLFLIVPEKAITAHFGATIPKIDALPSLALETVLTFFLMLVSMASATDTRFKRSDSGLTIGFVILTSGLFANSLSGASMNPARSLAPALFAGGAALANLWIYFVGPALGAALASVVYELIRGNVATAKAVLDEPPDRATVTAQAVKAALEEESQHSHER